MRGFARIIGRIPIDAEPGIPRMKIIVIRAVLFQEAGWWCGQCLEHDIATQARTFEGLKAELLRTLSIHADLAIERGQEPLAVLPKAPERYFQMYDAFAKVGGTEEATPIKAQDAQACILARFAYPELAVAHQ
jgi:hypothetical protein